MIAVFIARWHLHKGHQVTTSPDIYGGSHRRHYYCSCGKEWVG